MELKKLVENIYKNKKKLIIKNGFSHYLITGNSIKLLKKIPDNSIDLIVTDPPYNIGLDYGSYYKDRKKKKEYFSDMKDWLKESARIISDSGAIYLISYPTITGRLIDFIVDEIKLKIKNCLVWHYPTNIGHSKRNYTTSHRSILFITKSKKYIFNRKHILQPYKNPEVSKIKKLIEAGSKGRASYNCFKPSDLEQLNYELMDFLEVNLLKNVSKDRFDGEHPCQIPPQLLEIFVKVSSNEGDIVLDPFAGTFTLSAAAAKLRRHSLGIEINPNYVKLGIKRLKK